MHDEIGLKKIKKKFDYYPKEVWLFLLASEWTNIAEEEPFIGRCGELNDELGAKILTARLVESIMRILFVMEKEYIPYSKWFGTAFLKLNGARELHPILQKILRTNNWKEQERELARAYAIIGKKYNALKITKKLSPKIKPFHDRPYQVIHGDRYAEAIMGVIHSKKIKRIRSHIGSVNQITNTVGILENNELLARMKLLYLQ